MTSPALDTFVAESIRLSSALDDPADCVLALAPLMLQLIGEAGTFLEPQHFMSHPDHYARNLVYAAPDDSLSLYTLVWMPGQWTPVHDHGSWGVVGVVEGVLEERSYVRLSPDRGADTGAGRVRRVRYVPSVVRLGGVASSRGAGRNAGLHLDSAGLAQWRAEFPRRQARAICHRWFAELVELQGARRGVAVRNQREPRDVAPGIARLARPDEALRRQAGGRSGGEL